MSKLICSLTFMLVLCTFHVTQGMSLLPKETLATVLHKNEHKEKFRSALAGISSWHDDGYYSEDGAGASVLTNLEDERDQVLYKLIQYPKLDLTVRCLFDRVLSDICTYDPDYIDVKITLEKLDILQDKRNEILSILLKRSYEEFNAYREELTNEGTFKFKAVLLELQAQKPREEKQEYQLSEDLIGFFEREISLAQEEKEQNAAFEELSQSLVVAENLLLDAEKSSDVTEKKVAPVTVGYWTMAKDWWYGPSNLADELNKDKISLETLKESRDMQERVNGIIAKCSPSKKRNPEMLISLDDIYTPLGKLNFKFVDSAVNSDVYNACLQWQQDEEAEYSRVREARIRTIAQWLVQEMKKLNEEEEPRIALVEKLEKIKQISKQTGIVEQIQEGSIIEKTDVPSPKVVDMVCHLEELSAKILEEKENK